MHTRWIFDSGDRLVLIANPEQRFRGADVVARVVDDGIENAVAIERGKLLAAAPELLNACSIAVAALSCSDRNEALAVLMDAIRKATT